jgi:hypothetical protein
MGIQVLARHKQAQKWNGVNRTVKLFGFVRTWWRQFKERVVLIKFDIYVFITSSGTLLINRLESQGLWEQVNQRA